MNPIKNKVVMIVTAFLLTAFTVNTAVAQPPHAKAYGKHKYYYYPGSNVYYDAGPKLYYYNSGPSWLGVSILPPSFRITIGAPRYVVYHNTPEIWNDNHLHAVKYKAYKNKPDKTYKNKSMKHKNYKKHGKGH